MYRLHKLLSLIGYCSRRAAEKLIESKKIKINDSIVKVGDKWKEGDIVKVKVIGFDDRGKVKLSMKRVNQETGEDIESKKDE